VRRRNEQNTHFVMSLETLSFFLAVMNSENWKADNAMLLWEYATMNSKERTLSLFKHVIPVIRKLDFLIKTEIYNAYWAKKK